MIQHFDEAARDWDSEPRRVALAKDIGDGILEGLKLNPSMSLLEVGAGTGLVALRVLPHVKSILAIDTSKPMLDVIKEKCQQSDVKDIETLVWNLEEAPLAHRKFDAVISAMTFHHIKNIHAVLDHVRAVLPPGGQLAVADLDWEDGSFHDADVPIHHTGFKRDAMQAMLQETGFVNMQFTTPHTIVKNKNGVEKAYPVFLVCAKLGE